MELTIGIIIAILAGLWAWRGRWHPDWKGEVDYGFSLFVPDDDHSPGELEALWQTPYGTVGFLLKRYPVKYKIGE